MTTFGEESIGELIISQLFWLLQFYNYTYYCPLFLQTMHRPKDITGKGWVVLLPEVQISTWKKYART